MTVEKEILFEDLPLYAPNGSEYVYSIQEVKTNLGAMTPGPGTGDQSSTALESTAQNTQVDGLKPTTTRGWTPPS